MHCPFCSSTKVKVIDKRSADTGANRRRRECLECGKRFTTYERIEVESNSKCKVPFLKKRDGRIAEFDQNRITEAIFKAAEAVGGHDRKVAEELSDAVVDIINQRYNAENIPSVEDIQDIVEKVLIEKGHAKTAKAYIIYRQKRKEMRDIKGTLVDTTEAISEYLDRTDWRVRENSNEDYSFSGLMLHIAGKVIASYALSEIYPPEIADSFRKGYFHIHDLSHGFIGYCAGWSIKNLLTMGFGGVSNKADAKPAKHMSTLVHQMINYIGCLQMEFAGAQAFSSVDTYLAPFVRSDNMTYKDVKQCMQQLIYSLNIPSRWGCFSEDTEILTEEGWKLGKELEIGDIIATFNKETEKIEYLPVERMTIDHYKGKMYNLKNRIMDQLITPNHRVLRKIHNYDEDVSESKYVFEEANRLKTKIPLIPLGGKFKGIDMHEDYVRALAWIVSEGSLCREERVAIHQSFVKNPEYCAEIRACLNNLEIPFDEQIKQSGFTGEMSCLRFRMNRPLSRKICNDFFPDYVKKIPDELRNLNTELARIFIDTYMKADGHPPENKIYTKNKRDADVLQEMIIKSGWGSTLLKNKNGIFVVRVIKHDCSQITSIKQVDYDGIVWCPTTENNTVIVRRNGKVFISGNSQYPFSNLTFDWQCPVDLKDEKALVGGKKLDFTYGECQKEMDMLNRAFIEVMYEGDAKGRIFTFPIPTYNITKDFDWDSENAKLLFEMTAKYGTPYFQNYVGSNLDPKSIRAMCLHPDEEILVKKDSKIQKTTIGNLVEMHADKFDAEGWSENNHDIKALALCGDNKFAWTQVKRFLRIKGRVLSEIKTKDGKSIKVSSDHLVPVMTESGIRVKRAGELSNNDYMLTARSALSALSHSYQKIGDYVFDEMFAKFAGFFVSEGNYLYDSRKPKSPDSLKGFQFTFNSSECSKIDEVKDIIKNRFGLLAKTKKDPRYNTIAVYLYNTVLAKSLYNAGLKKYNSVPPQLFASPKSVIESFLDYVFKGDGYAKGKEIHLNDISLSRELVLLYTLIGKPVTYREKKRSQVIRIQHNYGRGSRNRCNRDVLYDRVPSFMVDLPSVSGRRRANFRQAETIGNQLLVRFGGHCAETLAMLKNDIALVQIENVSHTVMEKEQLFYDIELEENHLFVHSLGAITHNCCRLNMNQTELMNRPGNMWGPGDNTGSLGVVTINMNRLGYEAKSREEFFEKLKYYMTLAKNSLEIKRKIVSKNLENGLMPYTKVYLGTFRNHFSTIGLCGMHECCLNFLGKGIDSAEGKEFSIEALNFMRSMLKEFQQETGNLYNLEATPAESTSYRFAMLDKKMYPDIITSGKDFPFLTNSSQLPVDKTNDLIEALEHQNDIQPLYTGGTVFHTFLGEKISSGEACKRLVKKIAYNTRLPYFSITPTFSVCKNHGYISGEHPQCPECNEATEVYSRIVGYFRPIRNWNDGKKEEFRFRLEFTEQKAMERAFKSKIESAIEKQCACEVQR